MTYIDTSRGPFFAMLDRQALARQAQTGESYAAAFTKIYEDPANRAIRDRAQYDHIAKAHDAIHGTKLSLEKAAPPDPAQCYVSPAEAAARLGPAHAKIHSQAIDFRRANPRHSYESAYSRVYSAPENANLRAEINREHLAASMAAAPR
jgi:hypothetical protein